jgi:hypothetical protein
VIVARLKQHMDRELNLQCLAESFGDISAKDYLHCAIDIMADEI